MLDILRQNAKSVLTYVLFGIIIVVFVVSFGPGSRGCADPRVTQATWAAKVNGETVSGPEYVERYESIFRTYQAQAGQGFTRELAEQMGLRRLAMDQLVEREVLLQEGERLGIAVTDEELEKAIVEIPAFRVGGRFDAEAYKKYVPASFGSVARFEERMRRDLLSQKVLTLLRGAAQVSEDEVREAYAFEGDRCDLEFVRFPISGLQGQVKATPEQVAALQAKDPERIAKVWKESPQRFDKKKRVHARHVLIRADEGAPADVDAAARKKAEEALARARKGEDFARVASELSEDPSSQKKGGDLGWFGPGIMAKPFEDAAFATPAGGLAGPVRTRFGWHVIQVLEVQEPEAIPLEKAAPGIARELVEADLARAEAARRAGEALARARRARTLAELFPSAPEPQGAKDAKAAKGPTPVKLGVAVLRAEDTGSFSAGASPEVPRVGSQPELFAAAFAASAPGLLPKVYDTPAGPLIARVKDRSRPDPARYAGARDALEDRLRSRREAELERGLMRVLRDRAQVEVNEAYIRGQVSLPPVQLD